LIRVPYYKPGHEKATRAELRCPDPSCNPYLAFAVMLAAGLEGIEKKYEIPDPIEPNIYKMEIEEKERRGLKSLPIDLFEALKASEKSKIVREALGEHIFPRFIHLKAKEWEDFRIRITSYEIEKYLNL
jgi:glutamine synthetase